MGNYPLNQPIRVDLHFQTSILLYIYNTVQRAFNVQGSKKDPFNITHMSMHAETKIIELA